jgi:hypothetical protein
VFWVLTVRRKSPRSNCIASKCRKAPLLTHSIALSLTGRGDFNACMHATIDALEIYYPITGAHGQCTVRTFR